MCELRAIGTELVATPLVPTPPVSAVRARADRYVAGRRRRNALVASVVLGLTVTGITKMTLTSNVDAVRLVGDPGSPTPRAETTTTTTAPELPSLDAEAPFLPWSGQSFNGEWGTLRKSGPTCPLHVNPKLPTVKVAIGYVPRSTFEPSPNDAVEHVFQAFNNSASICGRAVELVRVVDYTDIPGDVVAVAGLPLDNALETAISDRRFEHMGLPVVGGDGLSAVHHSSPAVYPVGTSAAALARIAAHHAGEHGASSFAVIYDNTRAFGGEAAAALADHVRRTGGTLKASIGLDPTAAGDATKSAEFARVCANRGCDVVFLAMLPETAATWLMGNPHEPRLGTAALPTLMTSGFADACFATSNKRCNGLTAWTGFIPPFGRHAENLEAVAAWSPSWTEPRRGSAMIESAVVGTRVLLEALVETGPQVNRARLRRTLDNMEFVSHITAPLRWPRGTPRVGNANAQAWQLSVGTPDPPPAQGTDEAAIWALQAWLSSSSELPGREWHEVGTGWRTDPQ